MTKYGTFVISIILALLLASCSDSNPGSDGDSDLPPVTDAENDDDLGTGTGGVPPTLTGAIDSGVSVNTIDRMGRPGITTAAIELRSDRTIYNQNGDPATWTGEFREMIRGRLVTIDGLDGIDGNALLDVDTIASLLVDDRLQIDTSVPECDIYLAIEIGLGGCGGRTLERDVIDDTLRHLVSQDMPVSDNAINDSVILTTWPFLGEALEN